MTSKRNIPMRILCAIGRLIKKLLCRLGRFVKDRWAAFVSFILIWIVPLVALNCQVALIQTVEVGIRVTWLGCVAVAVLFFATRKRLWAQIYRLKSGVFRAVLMDLYLFITWGLVFGVLVFINLIAHKLYVWWIVCGISFLLAGVFRIIDQALLASREQNKEYKNEGN